MQRTRPLLIITILLTLAALLLFIINTDNTSDKNISEFSVEDTSSISKVILTSKDKHSITLERKDSSRWELNKEQVANNEAVTLMLSTIANLEVKGIVPRSMQEQVIQDLNKNSTTVEIYQQRYLLKIGAFSFFPFERKLKTFLIGKLTENNEGLLAKMEKSEIPVILFKPVQEIFVSSPFSARIEDWKIHTIFNKDIEEIQNVKVEFFEEPEESFEIESDLNKGFKLIKLVDNKEILNYDTLELISYLSSFKNIMYEKSLSESTSLKKEYNLGTPVHQVTLVNKDNNKQIVKTYRLPLEKPIINEFDGSEILFDRDRMIGLINDKNLVILQLFVFDNILVPLSTFTRQPTINIK